MQNLWARVAQVRCTSSTLCLSDSIALSRRTTTSAFKFRLRPLDVFTVFYSSVLFTAAIADTTRKQARLRELNDAVGVARADLEALEDQQQSRLKALSYPVDGKEYRLVQGRWAWKDAQQTQLEALSNTADEKNDRLVQWRCLREDQQQSRLETIPNMANEKKCRLVPSKWTWKDQDEKTNALLSNFGNVGEMMSLAVKGAWGWDDIYEWESQEMKAREAAGFKDFKGVYLNVLENLSASQIEDAVNKDSLSIRILRASKPSASRTSDEVSEPKSFPLSWKKVRTLEWSTLKLACTLLLQANDPIRPLDGQSEKLHNTLIRYDKKGSRPSDSSSTAGSIEKSATRLSRRLTKRMERQKRLTCLSTNKTKRRMARRIEIASHRLWQLSKIPQESHFDFERFPRPQAPNFSCWYDHQKGSLLNSSLADIFQTVQSRGDSLSVAIGKIFHQLLIFDTPPNIHTYTLLVKTLAALRHPRAVKSVSTSMNECNIRSNSNFLAALLDFYSGTLDSKEFKILARRMKGCYNGLAVVNPNTNITPISCGRYRFTTGLGKDAENYIDRSSDPRDDSFPENASPQRIKIYKKADMNPKLYGALIHGSLKLFGCRQAMANYINMISEGYAPTLRILWSILKYCYREKDWEGGYLTWRKIQVISPGASFSRYFWVLELCRKCRKTGMFRLLLKEGAQSGVFPAIVTCFSEEQNMDIEKIVQFSIDYMELRERLRNRSSFTEPAIQLWRYLSVICYEMVKMSKEFKNIELSIGRAPVTGRDVARKIGSARQTVSSYTNRLNEENWRQEKECQVKKSWEQTRVEQVSKAKIKTENLSKEDVRGEKEEGARSCRNRYVGERQTSPKIIEASTADFQPAIPNSLNEQSESYILTPNAASCTLSVAMRQEARASV